MEKKECLDRTWPQGELLYWNSPTDEMKKKKIRKKPVYLRTVCLINFDKKTRKSIEKKRERKDNCKELRLSRIMRKVIR